MTTITIHNRTITSDTQITPVDTVASREEFIQIVTDYYKQLGVSQEDIDETISIYLNSPYIKMDLTADVSNGKFFEVRNGLKYEGQEILAVALTGNVTMLPFIHHALFNKQSVEKFEECLSSEASVNSHRVSSQVIVVTANTVHVISITNYEILRHQLPLDTRDTYVFGSGMLCFKDEETIIEAYENDDVQTLYCLDMSVEEIFKIASEKDEYTNTITKSLKV